jgi:hypothetical protein
MRRLLGAAAGTLSLAAVVAGTSVTAASASAASSRNEHFQFVSVSASSARYSAIAWGSFTAGGTININTGRVVFPRGTFRAIHHRTSAVSSLNRRTCRLVSVEHGTYRLADGTARYRHIRGHGTYTSRVWAVLARNSKGRCSHSKPPKAFQNIINARGPVRGLPGHGTTIHPWAAGRSARRAG